MADYSPPPYEPNTVNQTVDFNGVTWKGNPGTGWTPVGYTGGGGVASQYASSIASNIQNIKPYNQVDPFAFDKELARTAATSEYSPYYDEMLSQYTQKMDTTINRSAEDLRNMLSYLNTSKEQYMGTARRLLDKALRSTNEGYAGNGLFFSGARERDVRELKTDTQSDIEQYMTGYNYKTGEAGIAAQRTKEDAELNKQMYTTDIGRQKTAAIEGGVLQRKSEAVQDYEMKRANYYEDQTYLG